MSNTIYVLGSGVFAKELRSYLMQSGDHSRFGKGSALFFVDDTPAGELTVKEYQDRKGGQSVMGSGHPWIREKMLAQIRAPFYSYSHPAAWISADSDLRSEDGIVIGPMVVIAPGVKIHQHVLVNYGAVVSHDVEILPLSVVAPSAVILGNCKIGRATYIGANSTIREKVTIGHDCMIGMGAVVLKDVPDGHVAVGNPARIVSKIHWQELKAKRTT